jgi:hypothetical protein
VYNENDNLGIAADFKSQRRKEVNMKKSTIFVLLLLAAMLLGITMAVSAESKEEHWAAIDVALHNLATAIDTNTNVSSALTAVGVAVSNGNMYLTSQKMGDPRTSEITRFAGLATTDKVNYKYWLAQAHAVNNMIFGEAVTGRGTDSDHS